MALRMGSFLRSSFPELRIEPTSRRLRCQVDGTTVGDTIAAMVVWEPRRGVPVFAVPERDFTGELLPFAPPPVPDDLPPFAAGRELPGAAFRPADQDLAGYVVLDFDAFDWVEEDEAVIGHPHDPPTRSTRSPYWRPTCRCVGTVNPTTFAWSS